MHPIINLSFINHPLQVKSEEHTSDPSSLMKIYIGLLGNIVHEWYYQLILFLPCESIYEEIERHRFNFQWSPSWSDQKSQNKIQKIKAALQKNPLQKKIKGCQLNFGCVTSFISGICQAGSVGEGVGIEAVIPALDLCFMLLTKWHIHLIYRV